MRENKMHAKFHELKERQRERELKKTQIEASVADKQWVYTLELAKLRLEGKKKIEGLTESIIPGLKFINVIYDFLWWFETLATLQSWD